MNLTRDHLGKIVRFDTLTLPEIPDGVFKEGDVLILCNNTDEFTSLRTFVKAYRSGIKIAREFFEIPPRSLVNVVFVADDVAIITVGL